MEQWKQFRYSIYEVSNIGEVRNKNTKQVIKQHNKNYDNKDNQYKKITLYINKKSKRFSVHRMVAECFLDNFSEELEVNHKNSNRDDNRVENLEMTTKEENYQHSIKSGKGSARKPVYLEDEQKNIKDFISLWSCARYIKDNKNINASIDHICNNLKQNINGKCKTAYGYKCYWK